MELFALISERPLIWGLFLAYMVVTGVLAWLGHKKTTDVSSFAIGSGDMHPAIVGITLAASIASTATFVINPGFVYVHGVSALMHLGVAAGLGVIVGLLLLSPGFRRIGAQVNAITLPEWVGRRYESKAMRLFFSAVSLLSFTFVVLIVGGLALVMKATLGLGLTASAALVVGFVFSYVFVGGATAHAYTNTLQGVLMVGVAIVIVGSGLHLLGGDVGARLAAIDPNLIAVHNAKSPLFNSFFSVWVSGFVIGFAVVCQPHILTKALYVKSDRDVKRYLAVTIAVSLTFTSLLLVGLYARLKAIGPVPQDMVMAVYITQSFSPTVTAIITVALLAAGMSTLDGLLVALSATVAHDLVPKTNPKTAHRISQLVLVVMGTAAFVVAIDPPELLGIFGQIGVYGIVAASCVPVLFGVLVPKAPRGPVFAAAIAALVIHLGLYSLKTRFPDAGFFNPAVTATWGTLAALAIATLGTLLYPRAHASSTPPSADRVRAVDGAARSPGGLDPLASGAHR